MELARGDGRGEGRERGERGKRGQRGERAEGAPALLDPHAGMISRKDVLVKSVG